MNTEAHTQRKHAKLAPSAASRWMNCPGSVKLSEPFPNTTSRFAAEGTAAHELAAYCLQNDEDAGAMIGQWFDTITGQFSVDAPDDPGETWFEVTDDMADAVQVYLDHFNDLASVQGIEREIEQRLDMTHLHPDISGTGDGLVFDPVRRHLHVLDYKHGKGVVVSAEENKQLMLYASGAARRYHNRGVQTLTLHIVQPRAAGQAIKTYDFDVLDLLDFEAAVAAAAKLTEQDGAPTKAGDWCRFCPALAICPTAREASLSAVAEDFGDLGDITLTPPAELTPERLTAALDEADRLLTYIKAVQQYAHDEACRGNPPKGWKLVNKRAVRRWRDSDEALAALLAKPGVVKDELFTEPKLKSPAQLEKLFPGKNKDERQAAMADLVVKSSSGVNLAPESDPRPAVKAGADADFDGNVEID